MRGVNLVKGMICGMLLLGATNAGAQEVFMPGTQDIPLMDGLKIDITDDMNFDTPEGQVIVFDAVNRRKTGQEIRQYYRATLPEMGWKETQTDHYEREGDSITLTVIEAGRPGTVRFEITATNTNE